MKKTPISDIHEALGAKMVDFAGYYMPLQYEGIQEEHDSVRKNVGLFDVSHMGEFVVKGREAEKLVQSISSNDVKALVPGEAQYSCMPNDEGGIVDDMLVYRLFEDQCSEDEKAFLLVVNASNMQKDWDWITSKNVFDTRMINISEETGLLALQGPKAIQTLQKLTDIDLSEIKYYTFRKGTVSGIENLLISATGYTGSGGFELYVRNEDLAALWNALMHAGQEFDIQPCGLGARDTLRLEMGFCLYGNDIDDTTSPIEAGLGWITKFTEGNDFPSRDMFEQQKLEGVKKKLVAFETEERRVPRHGYLVFDQDENEIGVVTSGTQSPSLDKPIGLAYVRKENSKMGNTIYFQAGKKLIPATIVRLPFYKV
ncbi:MAG TPA: glycine cleavage system aminomethyltransferase GcvT [Saprospiraceae bacterium]|nr:glycine cleavage system aminomethyltransferase GcvT [Saprospiraceae bacterium]MCB9328798.1 glycine cleavage system aminomethyltransferase GcvT [Lewinellaceae bacterium]HPQ20350.1 glycine cleavage system aminomethyltransferase GcvT [Saprospiraceae bacterium]HRX28855.1 glycine cleavage system aminomethyltransferase GcvT [Saprospiraceae bacterium]